ncbi:nucleotide-binding protein [Serratia phage vB_SmaS_Opt-155]|uniref:Nucleotide-binding protein n=1 Tax=Serratia phage vB_SmaS_Opt-155 TaxID=2902690 RepID=A0AC61TQ29_9CAUD|nr:nucleotide-binding protein [Serratia phage vB_SmaS_Opt-155]UGO52766.1 nucleotide-binding protein [Serratia phage vB_SmaS_Opt-155]
MIKKKAPKGILAKAKQVTEMDGGMTCLFYGRSGTGKTTLAGSFPTPILILDMGEKGTDSLSDVDGVKVLEINSWDELEEVYWALEDGSSGYKTVVLDALPGVQQLAIQKARELSRKKDGDMTSQRDMGEATKLMHTWLYNYRDLKGLGINVVMNAHDRIRETDSGDEEAIAPEVGPNLMPGISKAIMGAVDVIGVTFIRILKEKKKIGQRQEIVTEYCLRIGPHEFFNTKIRVPKGKPIPEFIIDPTYDKLKSVIKGESGAPKRTLRSKRLNRNK